MTTVDLPDTIRIVEEEQKRHGDITPGEWVKKNLFNNWYNSVITVVFGALALFLAFRFIRFVLVTGRWEPVRVNLELFMVGLFPRAERTRIVAQLFFMAGSIGLLIGWNRNRAIRAAELAGIERPATSWRDIVGVYWALAAFIGFSMIIGVRTLAPWLVLLGAVLAAVAGFAATTELRNPAYKLILITPLLLVAGTLSNVQDLPNGSAYLIGAVASALLVIVHVVRIPAVRLSAGIAAGVAGFQALSGTSGWAWFFIALALLPTTLHLTDRDDSPGPLRWAGVAAVAAVLASRFLADSPGWLIPLVLIVMLVLAAVDAVRGDGGTALRLGAVAVVGALSWLLGDLIGLSGIDWEQWNGLHLNLVVAAAAIVLAFPIGLLLALGRRSTLPVVRWMCTAYIELIRGVPLISLLLMGQLFIGFFLNTDTPLSLTTRSTVAITMFSAAYIAEIVRGGLQAVPKGQTEAGKALGMAPASITRLLVLPQALRAVIPAMVGQFISLFKDTSLLTIIGLVEFLGVRELVHTQEAFRGFGIAETLLFVAFGFWAVSFAMSRQSQRLEKQLGVGSR